VVLPESLTACRGAWALGYLPFAAPSFDLVCFGFLGVLAFLSIGCSSAMPWVRSILPRPGHDGTAPPTAGGCRAQVATGTSLRQRSGSRHGLAWPGNTRRAVARANGAGEPGARIG